MRRSALALLAVVAVTVLAGCGSSGSDSSKADDTSATTSTTAASFSSTTAPASSTGGPASCAKAAAIPKGVVAGKPTSVDLPAKPTKGDVKVTVLKEGNGPEVTDSSYVTVHYLGVSCTSGEQFDSSWDRGDPITIAMPGATPTQTAFSVIEGWNKGLVGQKQGTLVQLDIPSDLGYGPAGSPPAIAPNDPLTFVILISKVSDTAPPGP